MISNTVTGLVGLALITLFLGNYAVTLKAIPLWAIIVGTLALVAYDYLGSLRAAKEQQDDDAS